MAGRRFCGVSRPRIGGGRTEGPYTDLVEIICCDGGDDPDRDHREISPGLQLVRGRYPLAAGVAAYEQHLRLHHQPPHAAHVRRATEAG
jgi:hypothetical protein